MFAAFPYEFSNILSTFINDSLKVGIFPSIFFTSKVLPVFKKGSTLDINCYRPISKNSALSKLYEKLVYNQVYSYLCKYNMIYSRQFGFSRNSNTETAFIYLVSTVSNFISERKKCILIFVDFSKAFDSISHTILLNKLKNIYGFKVKALQWFSSYLSRLVT